MHTTTKAQSPNTEERSTRMFLSSSEDISFGFQILSPSKLNNSDYYDTLLDHGDEAQQAHVIRSPEQETQSKGNKLRNMVTESFEKFIQPDKIDFISKYLQQGSLSIVPEEELIESKLSLVETDSHMTSKEYSLMNNGQHKKLTYVNVQDYLKYM